MKILLAFISLNSSILLVLIPCTFQYPIFMYLFFYLFRRLLDSILIWGDFNCFDFLSVFFKDKVHALCSYPLSGGLEFSVGVYFLDTSYFAAPAFTYKTLNMCRQVWNKDRTNECWSKSAIASHGTQKSSDICIFVILRYMLYKKENCFNFYKYLILIIKKIWIKHYEDCLKQLVNCIIIL